MNGGERPRWAAGGAGRWWHLRQAGPGARGSAALPQSPRCPLWAGLGAGPEAVFSSKPWSPDPGGFSPQPLVALVSCHTPQTHATSYVSPALHFLDLPWGCVWVLGSACPGNAPRCTRRWLGASDRRV